MTINTSREAELCRGLRRIADYTSVPLGVSNRRVLREAADMIEALSEGVSAASGFDPSRGEWPERAIRVAEALEHEVTTERQGSLWCRLCERDIGADGQLHAPHCVLNNEVSEAPSSRAEPLEDALRSLASYVGAGGYNAETVDPDVFERKVRWGIDHLVNATIRRCADIIEEESKNPARATFGAIKRAILDLRTDRDSDRSGEAIETPSDGSTEGESAGPKGIAP